MSALAQLVDTFSQDAPRERRDSLAVQTMDGLRRFRALVLAEGEQRAPELAGREHDFPSGY